MQKTSIFHGKIASISLLLAGLIFVAGCSKQKQRDEMSFDELTTTATAYLDKKKPDAAITYLEELNARFADHKDVAGSKMLLAETYFANGNYAAAQQLYDHYTQFYPADPKAEYAKYKSVLAMFYQTLNPDCDQSETEDTLNLCKAYLHNNNFTEYKKDVLDIKKTCEQKLIDKEFYIAHFYLKHKNIDAAQMRLKNMRTKFLAENPDMAPRLERLEAQVNQLPLTAQHKTAQTFARLTQTKDSTAKTTAKVLTTAARTETAKKIITNIQPSTIVKGS